MHLETTFIGVTALAYIEKVEIQYFRSIYREVIGDLRDLNIFTGKNDAGKSNVLKALNLFFNNQTDAGKEFSFGDNFNFTRLDEVRKDSIKGKQFIQIKITFCRGNRFEKTLPSRFTVIKKWYRNDIRPSIIDDDLKKRLEAEGRGYGDRNRSSLTAYLNKIRFIYIPAIKDDTIFRYVLNQLRETIYNDKLMTDSDLATSMTLLADRISGAAKELNEEFEQVTGVASKLSSPQSITDLYRTIGIETKTGDATIGLDKRGDGIRVRYLPSILHYMASNSNNMYIWGFEEPENSLEYNLTLKMASDFNNTYCKKSSIFITSHSPCFIGLKNGDTTHTYRCFHIKNGTSVIPLERAEKEAPLSQELGYVELQKDLFNEYSERLALLEKEHMYISQLRDDLAQASRPIIYTEGQSDVDILKTAWDKIYPDQVRPFDIKSCNVLPEGSNPAAGCGLLKGLLQSTQPDSRNIIIGIFDNDAEGQKSFELGRNFYIKQDGWKVHKNGKSHALLLPVPPGKELFAKYKNLCIEYYFAKDDLDKRVDGKGLRLIPQVIPSVFNGQEVERRQATELHFHKIDSSTKTFFAQSIVPTLPVESFVHFKKLYELIIQIVSNA